MLTHSLKTVIPKHRTSYYQVTAEQQRSENNGHSSTKYPQNTKPSPLATPSPTVLARTTPLRDENVRLVGHHLYHQHWQKEIASVSSSPSLQVLSSQDHTIHGTKSGNEFWVTFLLFMDFTQHSRNSRIQSLKPTYGTCAISGKTNSYPNLALKVLA